MTSIELELTCRSWPIPPTGELLGGPSHALVDRRVVSRNLRSMVKLLGMWTHAPRLRFGELFLSALGGCVGVGVSRLTYTLPS